MLELKHLTASIGEKIILTDISFRFEKGKTYVILGPNGSGKSTLANTILGRSDIRIDAGSDMLWDNTSILNLTPDRRAKIGLFVSFQSPPALPGVSIFSLLRFALPKIPALETRRKVESLAQALAISKTLLHRGLYDGFSGGEKKKFEALLWAMLQPKISFFDELDTGVDVDARKLIGNVLKTHRTSEQTLVFITHSTTFLDMLPPDETLVMGEGKIIRTGDGSLARRIIEKEGFGKQE